MSDLDVIEPEVTVPTPVPPSGLVVRAGTLRNSPQTPSRRALVRLQ